MRVPCASDVFMCHCAIADDLDRQMGNGVWRNCMITRRELVDRGSVADAMNAAQVCHPYVDLRGPRMELRDVVFRARAGQGGQGLRVDSIPENVTRLGVRRSAREPSYARLRVDSANELNVVEVRLNGICAAPANSWFARAKGMSRIEVGVAVAPRTTCKSAKRRGRQTVPLPVADVARAPGATRRDGAGRMRERKACRGCATSPRAQP